MFVCTQVIAQTKAALADAGINTKALEAAASASGSAAAHKSVARSSTSLLVKNLPYSADTDELQQLFVGPTGRTLVRMVLPPTKTLAVVEFGEPQDARYVQQLASWLPLFFACCRPLLSELVG